jgi:hypothetical protein
MPFHVSAFWQTAMAASAIDTITPAVLDQSINTQNNRIQLMENRSLIGAWAAGTFLTLAKMDSASLLLNGRPIITPINQAAGGGNLPGIEWYQDMGFTLPMTELIGVLSSTSSGGASDINAALFHTKGITPIQGGPIRTVRATAAAAGAKGLWALSPLTFDTLLAVGTYRLVGAVADGANLNLLRFVFPNQIDRPGMPGVSSVANYVADYFRRGNVGGWGDFQNYNPPQIEALGSGTLSTQEIFLDLMKIA